MLKFKSLVVLPFLSGLLLWNGCSTNSPVSTEPQQEISISPEFVATLTFQSLAETGNTADLLDISNPAPSSMLSSPQVPQLSLGKHLLAKSQAGLTINIDTLDEFIRICSRDSSLGYVKADTVEFLPGVTGNEKIISIRGSTVYITGKTEFYDVKDLDGDDMLNGDTPLQSLQLITITTFGANLTTNKAGQIEYLSVAVDAGEDNDFSSDSDNRILDAEWIKSLGHDTLGHVRYSDADGDGIISAETGSLDIFLYESKNPFKPLVDYSKIIMRIEKTNGTERTIRFCAEKKYNSGRLNRVWVLDSTGDSSISIGEKAYIHLATNSPSVADSEITAQILYVIDPGADMTLLSDNLLYGLEFTKTYRLGIVKDLQFSFTADPPAGYGEDASGGSFRIDVLFVNDKTASLSGTFSQGELDATYINPDGVSTHFNMLQ